MKLSDFLSPDRILAELNATTKVAALEEMSHFLTKAENNSLLTPQRLLSAVMNREELGSTGIGDGVAIPHAKIHGLTDLCACFARSNAGVEFESIDGKPVRLFFMVLVPDNSAGLHLKALARISRVLKEEAFRDQLLAAADTHAIHNLFSRQANSGD